VVDPGTALILNLTTKISPASDGVVEIYEMAGQSGIVND